MDEANAAIGVVLAHGLPDLLEEMLQSVHGHLFIVGSELMAPDSPQRPALVQTPRRCSAG